MKKAVLLLLLVLISLYNYIVLTEANSTDTSTRNNELSKPNRRIKAYDRSKSDKRNINWTPELKSELIDLWEKTDPLTERQGERLHFLWSQRHKEYSNMSSVILKKTAETFIRRWRGPFDDRYFARLRILNEKAKFPWTKELKNSVIECIIRSDRNRTEFKRLWDERNPKYTHLDSNFLAKAADNFQARLKRGFADEKQVAWNKDLQAELMDIWDESYSPRPNSGHKMKIFHEWKRRHPQLCNFSPKHLKDIANELIQQDTAKRIAQGEKSEKLERRMEYIERSENHLFWTPKMISELLKCWRIYKLDIIAFQKCWQELEPKYAHLNAAYLTRAAGQFSWRKNQYSQKVPVEGHGKEHEERIGGDYGASANETSQSHQSIWSPYPSYAPPSGASRRESGENSRGTSRLPTETVFQYWPYTHQFKDSQHESGESSSRTLPPQQISASQKSSYIPHSGDLQYEYGGSLSGTPRLHLFMSPGESLYMHQLGDSDQGQGENLIYSPVSEHMNQDQPFLQNQRRKRRTTHRRELQKTESPKEEDLDLDLHLK